MGGEGVPGGRGNPGLSRPSLEWGAPGWCGARREPLREGGREDGHKGDGLPGSPRPKANLREGAGPTLAWFVFLRRLEQAKPCGVGVGFPA